MVRRRPDVRAGLRVGQRISRRNTSTMACHVCTEIAFAAILGRRRVRLPDPSFGLQQSLMVLPVTDPATALLIAVTFLIAGCVKGVIGLGMPVVVLALLATTIGLKSAIALMVVPGVIGNLWQALSGPAFHTNLARLWSMFAASAVAILFGVAALASVDSRLLTALLGLVLSAYAALSIFKPRLPPPREWEVWLSPMVGGVAGFMFGLTGTYMVPGVLYIEALGLRRDEFVQALGMTFTVISVFLGLGLVQQGLITAETSVVSVLSLVPLFGGLLLGQRIRSYVPEAQFRKLFFYWLFITGFVISGRAML